MLEPPSAKATLTGQPEPKDIPLRPLVVFTVLFVVVTAAVLVLLWWLTAYYEGREARRNLSLFPLAVEERGRLPPPPIIEGFDPTHVVGLQQPVLAERSDPAKQRLQSYGWVDRQAGRVHIPINRAMELLEEQLKKDTNPAGGNP